MRRPILSSAVATVVCLSGGLLLGAGGAALLTDLPLHAPAQTMNLVAGLIAFLGVFGGGALWGWRMSSIHNFPHRRWATVVSGLTFAFAVMLATFLPLGLRAFIQRQPFPHMPIHVIFTTVFVPTMFLVSTVGATAMLSVSGKRTNALGSGLLCGLTAALAFLIVDLILDGLGMRVGAPRAAERFTMLSVVFVSSAAGAFAGGLVLGSILSRAEPNNTQATG